MGEKRTCYLNTTQAAAVLGLSPRTLEYYRVAGGGPPFLTYCNRIHYLRTDLNAWALESRRRSTSDDGGGEDGRRWRDSSAERASASVETASGRAGPAGQARTPAPEDAGRPAGTAGNGSSHLSVDELAALLQVSRRTLDRYRVKRAGPAFEKVDGRVRYARANVEAWLASGRRLSRSDAGGETPDPAGGASGPDGGGPVAGDDAQEVV